MEPEQPAPRSNQQQSNPLRSAHRPQAQDDFDKWWLSESSEDEATGRPVEQRPQNNDDMLYDPNADDEDETWVQEQRQGHVTDAILSCPGCFTTLCIDCQQHEHYHTQYRAMITMNCEVKTDQPMQSQVQRQPSKQQSRRGRKRQAPEGCEDGSEQQQQQQQGTLMQQQQQQQGEEEVLYPVCCAVCGTQVGAQDSQEIVHFFHVLASEC